MSGLTAKQVVGLLAARHTKDVFVAECKVGPTHAVGGRVPRLDAWAMPRSWSKPSVHGYEVKVARQDFLRDEKWAEYMTYCNCMWFVAPKSLIQLEELPPEVGLLEVSKNGKRLFTRRKAVERDVEIPEDLWRYVLMCRAVISERDIDLERSSTAYWERWLRERKRKNELGYEVRGKIRDIANRLQVENDRLTRENEVFADVRKILDAAGIDSVDRWYTRNEVQRKIDDQQAGYRRDLKRALFEATRAIQNLEEEIEAVASTPAASGAGE